MVGCPARPPEDHRVHKIPVARQARAVRPETQARAEAAVDSRGRVEVSSDKEDKPEERKAEAAIKSPPEMTAPIHFPM